MQNESVLIVIFRIVYYKTAARSVLKKGPVINGRINDRFSKFRFKPERKGKEFRATIRPSLQKEGGMPQAGLQGNSLETGKNPNSLRFIFGEKVFALIFEIKDF